MRLEIRLLREANEHPSPTFMRTTRSRSRGRPRAEYRPRVRTAPDIARLRRHGVPSVLLTSEWVTRSGYPVEFRPWLLVPEGLEGQVDSDFRVLTVKDADALRDPGVEELITFLLKFDVLAARVVAVRNRARLDANELYRRVRNEGMDRQATKVRLQEFAPSLPAVGAPLPSEELDWIESNNPPMGPEQ